MSTIYFKLILTILVRYKMTIKQLQEELRIYIKMNSHKTYKEISQEIGIAYNTLKRFLVETEPMRKTIGKVWKFIELNSENDKMF